MIRHDIDNKSCYFFFQLISFNKAPILDFDTLNISPYSLCSMYGFFSTYKIKVLLYLFWRVWF